MKTCNRSTHSRPEVIHQNLIVNPSLCPPCYRETESEIDHRYTYEIACLSHQLIQVNECMVELAPASIAMEQNLEEGEITPLDLVAEEAVKLRERISQAKQQRKDEVAAFRESQGVWGDG